MRQAQNGRMTLRGFILQASYRIIDGRAVVHLFGRAEDGRTFLVRDARQRPHFYVGQHHLERAIAIAGAAIQPVPSECRSFAGATVARLEVALPADAARVRDRLHEAGVPTYEADVRFAVR